MLLRYLHNLDRNEALAATNSCIEDQIDCEQVMAEGLRGKIPLTASELEEYMQKMTDAEVVKAAKKEEGGCM